MMQLDDSGAEAEVHIPWVQVQSSFYNQLPYIGRDAHVFMHYGNISDLCIEIIQKEIPPYIHAYTPTPPHTHIHAHTHCTHNFKQL